MENYCNHQACSHIKIICRCITVRAHSVRPQTHDRALRGSTLCSPYDMKTVPSGKIRYTFIFHSPSSIFNYYPADAKTTRENLGWFSIYLTAPSPPMSAVSSSIRSNGNGGNATGFMAMDISFIGLSSAAARLECSTPQRRQR